MLGRMLHRLAIVLLCVALPSSAEPARRVPFATTTILLDGHRGWTEWSRVATIELDASHRLLLRQDREFLYAAIALENVEHSGAELYLADETGTIASYHISSALGRRVWRDGAWSPYEWQIAGWAANVIQLIQENGRTKVLAPRMIEYQIAKSLLRGKELRVRIELRRPVVVFPANASETNPAEWLAIRL